MNTEPKISRFLDKEEQALSEAIESSSFDPKLEAMDAKRADFLRGAAKATMNEERTRISIRVPNTDLSRLKAQAMREGVPYQTFINSVLHKAVNQ